MDGVRNMTTSSTFELDRSLTRSPPSHRARNLSAVLFGAGLLVSLGVVVPVASRLQWSAPGTVADVIGMTTAMAGPFLG